MTTTARPAEGQPRGTSPVLFVAGLYVAGAVVVTTLLGALTTGSPGAFGALAGGSMALCFFLFGSTIVEMATRMAPQTAIFVALMTYTLQVALVALVFAVLTSSGAVGTTLSPGWLAGGVIAATLAWTVAQLVGSARARIPAYDIDLPEPGQAAPQPSSQPSSGASSRAREVGAP